jgi:hypothetical protein
MFSALLLRRADVALISAFGPGARVRAIAWLDELGV